MRVVIADDILLVRSGIVRLLAEVAIEVVGEAADSASLLRLVALQSPDVAIVDIRMPPTHTDEGLLAARTIRDRFPATAVLLLSQYLQLTYARRLLADQPGGLGYLLKERVTDTSVLVDGLERVARGECVVDPGIAEYLLHRQHIDSPLQRLSPRERQILAAMAEGRSNAGIANRLGISERTVESVSAEMFRKLDLLPDPDVNRRVLAVLTLLQSPVSK